MILWAAKCVKALDRFRTRCRLRTASRHPCHLGPDLLEALLEKYPPRDDEYGYDPESLEIRGMQRAEDLLSMPGARTAESFLELGCWDGMVSCGLRRHGKNAYATDIRDTGLDGRAVAEGVIFQQMDCADLQYEDEAFDFVFSYDSFEHFASPEQVLREATRVVKTGGYIYLKFGPLYYAPWGLHEWEKISVPYCNVLFCGDTLDKNLAARGLPPVDFGHTNGLSLADYRGIWKKYSGTLKRLDYYERPYWDFIDLIKKYPSCFASKSRHLDNFVVSNISVLFQKTAHNLPDI